MAEFYTGQTGGGGMAMRARCVYEVYEFEDQVHIYIQGFAQEYYSYQYGVAVQAWFSGGPSSARAGYLTWNPGANWVDVVSSDRIGVAFQKRGTAYTQDVYVSFWGQTADGYGGWPYGGAQARTTITIPALALPGAPSGATSTRNDDSQNTVAWTNGSGVRSNVLVERQIDGGVWSQIASVSGSATSYVDSSAQTNHSYAYRVRSYNAAGHSAYAATGTTYNTPSAPTAVVASRSGSATVALAITNPAVTATALDVQRSTDASAWTTVSTVSGSAVASATDTPGGGTFYYRARNTRGSLVSDWSPASNSVVTIIAPAAPTLLTPASGVTVPKTEAAIAFAWQHNPIDGSAQTAAQLQYSTDGGTAWTTQTLTTAQTHSLANSFAVNATVTWRVRTKGAHADYGAYSAAQAFKVCQVPSVVITSPAADGAAIIDVPIAVAWSYSDQSGTQQRATVAIKNSAGAVLWTKALTGAAASVSIPSSELLPDNNAAYSIELVAISTSGLTASATRLFATDYEEPASPNITIEVDEEYGRVSAVIYEGASETGQPATASLGLFRRNTDGSLVSLVDHVQSGTAAVDVYPPLDREVAYIAVAYTGNGLTAQTENRITIPSGGAVFFNFGSASGFLDVAKVAMGVEWDIDVAIDSEVIETEGAEDPLVFYGTAKKTESGITGDTWWREALIPTGWGDRANVAAAFERLAKDVGIKIVRYPYGSVVPSHVTCKLSVSSANSLVTSVDISTRKVRADGLVI